MLNNDQELSTWEAIALIFAYQIAASGAIPTRTRFTLVDVNLTKVTRETYNHRTVL